jgi:large subunit ribosomal protein L32
MSIRMRHTKGHTRNRRSHHALVGLSVVKDKETGSLSLPHHLDESTGMYRGRQIVATKEKKIKAKAEKVEKHEHTHAHEHTEEKGSKGLLGKIAGAMRPKARSGAGGGGA